MCITNNFSEKTLKQLRAVESNSQDMTDRELCEVLCRIKKIIKDLEWGEEKIVKLLNERGFDTTEIFPEFESKVYKADGKSSTTYDISKIASEISPANFYSIISIVKKKIDELDNSEVTKIVEKYSNSNPGEPYITVRKMSKQELKEAL